MATAKKPTAKKKAPVKKPAPVKKAPVKKKAVTKKVSSKSASVKRVPKMRSFHVSKEPTSFNTFRITRQTVYWIILVAFIVFVQLWILKLQVEVLGYLDAQQAALEASVE